MNTAVPLMTNEIVTATFQKSNVSGAPIAPPLHVDMDDAKSKSLSVDAHRTTIPPCEKPKALRTNNRRGSSESTKLVQERPISSHSLDRDLASTLFRLKGGGLSKIPGWVRCNLLLSESKSLTQVDALPLLPGVAHEWPTLLTGGTSKLVG